MATSDEVHLSQKNFFALSFDDEGCKKIAATKNDHTKCFSSQLQNCSHLTSQQKQELFAASQESRAS